MKGIEFILLTLATTLFSLVASGQTAQKSIEAHIPDNWKSFDDTGFAIHYPDSFDMDTSGQMGMTFLMLSRQTSPQDMFRENVNLLIQNLPDQSISLDMFVEISEGQIKTLVTNGNLIDSKRLSANGKQFQRIIYSGRQGKFDLKWLQYYWVENRKAYVLTLTCEQNQYDKYVSAGEGIMKTFRIK